MEPLHAWLIAQRELLFEGLVITKVLDYSIKRWSVAHRQQLYRAANSFLSSWNKKLALRRVVTQRQTRCCADEFDPVGQVKSESCYPIFGSQFSYARWAARRVTVSLARQKA